MSDTPGLDTGVDRFRLAMDASGIGMAIVDLQGCWVEVNPAFERMFGYSANEVVGKPAVAFTHPDDVPLSRGYLRGLNRAERLLEADLPKYLPLWKECVPIEFQDRTWDFTQFSRGERFVYEPITKEEFEEVFRQVERWGLNEYLKDRSFESLVCRA